MGSIFSSPKPATVTPVVISTPAPVVETTPPTVEPVAEETSKTDESNRKGRSSTIATSYAGVLEENSFSPKRKNLLGE